MRDVSAILAQMLPPLRLEYQHGCLNDSVMGGFAHHLGRLVGEAQAEAPDDHPAGPHLERLAAIFAEYPDLDPNHRAKALRECKRRLDALLGKQQPQSSRPARLEPARTAKPPEHGLDSAVQFLKGVGPQRAKLLGKLGIETIGDLLFHFPRRHEDRSQMAKLGRARIDELATFTGRIKQVQQHQPRPRLTLTKAFVTDETGGIDLVWFNQPWLQKELETGQAVIFSGKPGLDRLGRLQLVQPAWEVLEPGSEVIHTGRLVPIYPLTEGLIQTAVRRWCKQTLDTYSRLIPEVLPDWLRDELALVGRREAVCSFHFPETEEERTLARRRLVFEEFFGLQVALAQRRHDYQHSGPGIAFETDSPLVKQLLKLLPFELTGAQQKVLEEIRGDMRQPTPMNRLLQGDVGSGKTLVALAAMLTVVDQGYQAAVMVPTEILAEQHHRVFKFYCEPLGVEVELFTGRAGAKQRRESRQRLRDGTVRIAVGTHALIQETVDFDHLGLVVVDEQHRFGVMQRQGLTGKAETPDVLVMTATPIPRTLALTCYGDLDTSVIDELPPGRRQIVTSWRPLGERQKVYSQIKHRLREGRQAYVVCPLVEESEVLEDVEAVTSLYEHLQEHFSAFRVGLIHGRLKSAEKDEVMTAFRAGELDVLAATTVIEVGIDVPNATVMLVVNADRFGLAQLHQLRGRVGRGTHDSECYLLTDAKYNPDLADDESGLQYRDGRARMRFMCRFADGFNLAEADLELRGPGELGGTRQSGVMDLRVANLARDRALLEQSRDVARELISRDPYLTAPECGALAQYVAQRFTDRGQLAEVG